jgi:Predicted GTPases
VADTPGFSQLHLEAGQEQQERLQLAFPEFDRYRGGLPLPPAACTGASPACAVLVGGGGQAEIAPTPAPTRDRT